MIDWMYIKEGENRVRIGGHPEQRLIHWITVSSRTTSVMCEGSCQYCQNGDKVQVRFDVPVIDRFDSKCKMLRIGKQVYQGIRDFETDVDWGDPRDYDIIIYRGPRRSQPWYYVAAIPHKHPLTEEEKDEIDRLLREAKMPKSHKVASHDKCNSCGGIGEMRGMACVCKQCNNIVWGC